MPDHTPMFISAIQDDVRLNFWDNVYGFQMPNIKEKVHRQLTSEPVVDHYNGEQCQLSDSCMFRNVDCQNGSVYLPLPAPTASTCSSITLCGRRQRQNGN